MINRFWEKAAEDSSITVGWQLDQSVVPVGEQIQNLQIIYGPQMIWPEQNKEIDISINTPISRIIHGEHTINRLISATDYQVCLYSFVGAIHNETNYNGDVQQQNVITDSPVTKPIMYMQDEECFATSTAKWVGHLAIGTTVGAILAFFLLVLCVLVARFTYKRSSRKKLLQEYYEMHLFTGAGNHAKEPIIKKTSNNEDKNVSSNYRYPDNENRENEGNDVLSENEDDVDCDDDDDDSVSIIFEFDDGQQISARRGEQLIYPLVARRVMDQLVVDKVNRLFTQSLDDSSGNNIRYDDPQIQHPHDKEEYTGNKFLSSAERRQRFGLRSGKRQQTICSETPHTSHNTGNISPLQFKLIQQQRDMPFIIDNDDADVHDGCENNKKAKISERSNNNDIIYEPIEEAENFSVRREKNDKLNGEENDIINMTRNSVLV